MRYGYEVQQDGTKTIHVFPDEATRARWIATSPSARGFLSGNSREVKAALYRDAVVLENLREKEIQNSF
jgi:hypothetical protein